MKVTDPQREVAAEDRNIHCKSLELPLNYHQRMIRYTFRVPPNVGEYGRPLEQAEWLAKCSRYIKKWIELIIVEKKRQMHAPEDMWPPWPRRSEASDVMTMPMVMWLSKAPKEKKACKRNSEGQTRPADGGPPPPPAPPPAADHRHRSSGFGMSGEYSC